MARVAVEPSVEDPFPQLPDTARRILAAACALLAERGLQGLTLTNIALESGENPALVYYYFGNKAGLIAAVVDSIVHDECVAISSRMKDVPPQQRMSEFIRAMRFESEAEQSFCVLFDILPYVLRHEELRERMVHLYEWYVELKLDWLGLDREADKEVRERLKPLARVFSAIIDGLAMQSIIDPQGFKLREPFEFVSVMLENSWEVLLNGPQTELTPGNEG